MKIAHVEVWDGWSDAPRIVTRRYYTPERRKVRGLRRRMLWWERWKRWYLDLRPQDLAGLGQLYAAPRKHDHPWRERGYHPPMPPWFRRYLVDTFVEIQRHLDVIARQHGVPYDLALWLQDDFPESEVILAWGATKERYEAFHELCPDAAPFPYRRFATPANDLRDFTWERRSFVSGPCGLDEGESCTRAYLWRGTLLGR
jgi:hypothetical protein